jgi:hypothetical protein
VVQATVGKQGIEKDVTALTQRVSLDLYYNNMSFKIDMMGFERRQCKCITLFLERCKVRLNYAEKTTLIRVYIEDVAWLLQLRREISSQKGPRYYRC